MPTPLHDPVIATGGDEVRPTRLEVDLGRLAANYRVICEHVGGIPVMPVLKANAYGHGLAEVGRLMDSLGAAMMTAPFLLPGAWKRLGKLRDERKEKAKRIKRFRP